MTIAFQNILIGSISILIAFYAKKFEENDKVKSFPDNPDNFQLPQVKEYDFIIVGAGSAGSTVANKLSKEFTVLLLEAGGDPIPQTYVPANFGFVFPEASVTHQWKSVKQTHNTLDEDGIAILGQGKFLGGSSVVNAMSYNRGSPKDYDNWATLVGDESWNYTNVLKYFRMTEDFHEERNADGHLGVDGPLTIRKGGKELKQSYEALLGGAKELGYKQYENSNGPQIEGFGYISETIRFGRRVSVYDAFIKPILDRNTLTISRYSTVSKVEIDKNNRAVGVYYSQHGIQRYAKANFEVILSAGAMSSPQILLRSGIGPKDQLKAAKIPVINNLPVGQNLQDHPFSLVCGKFEDESKYPITNISEKDLQDYLKKGSGPLTLPWGVVGQGFAVSSVAKSGGHTDWPDIQFIFFHDTKLYIPENTGENKVCLLAILGRPVSRGSISLDVKNISNPPIWDPRWLEDEKDLKIIVDAMKIATALFETKAFKNIGLKLIKDPNPACKHEEFGTDLYWQCAVRRYTRTTWHPVGSCKMGAKNDKNAVVDSKLRVKGIQGLRVIDNSIQPIIMNANTNAPAIMTGQKGAHMILSEYERGKKINNQQDCDSFDNTCSI